MALRGGIIAEKPSPLVSYSTVVADSTARPGISSQLRGEGGGNLYARAYPKPQTWREIRVFTCVLELPSTAGSSGSVITNGRNRYSRLHALPPPARFFCSLNYPDKWTDK